MSELSLKQIEDKLNLEFEDEDRSIIFWFDEKQEFIDYVSELELKNAKIHYLTPTNFFETKVILERKDKNTNYLIYAPFKKPDNRENHLADTILYSKEFFADRASLLAVDLGIDTVYRPVLEKYIKFFNAKERTERFYNLEIDTYNEETIELALLSALTRSKVVHFEEVLRIVLSEDLRDNRYMEEFRKYNLEEAFWKYCNLTFSYSDPEPSLMKLSISLLLTYSQKQMENSLPKNLQKYILNKPGTVMAFVDSMMNSNIYIDSFRRISSEVYEKIEGDKVFELYDIEDLIYIDIFKEIDEYIINWVLDKLLDENINMQVDGMPIVEVCKSRKFKHFKDLFKNQYNILISAYYLISYKTIDIGEDILDLVKQYDKTYYKIDSYYRKFYYYLDRIESNTFFEKLETLVENIYINRYLDKISKRFSESLDYKTLKKEYNLQKDFYNNFISTRRERVIVIISDAFRYEVGKELIERFEYNEKIEAKIQPQIGVVPSYTSLGMAALLPNESIEIDENYSVYVDGKPTNNLNQRKQILKARNPKSDAIQYDDLIKMKKEDMRKFFGGMEVIYIYHNQIDARGDNLSTEDEVFIACTEAINEIEDIIRILTNNVSATRFIVTSDHGFIYTRSKNKESDKIESFYHGKDKINKRFIISENHYEKVGTNNILISDVLENYDKRTITMPLTSDIFKSQGGGQNFVHGGSSPQEIIIPVIEVKSIRGSVETEDVGISLISVLSKLTRFSFNLDFIQQQAVSDTVKPATYKFRFVDKLGELVSNEEIYVAKSKSRNSGDRIFNLKFNLRNKIYSRDEEYYFTIVNIETGMEIYRQQVIIDIAFADDFELY